MKLNGNAKRPAVITGGAGFIGTNLASRLLDNDEEVVVFDNLSRDGVEENWRWLSATYGKRVRLIRGDIRNPDDVKSVASAAGSIFHFAAQVAVTTSLDDPLEDFEINARGTLNLLEAIRATGRKIPLLFTSTNKVYGDLEDVKLRVGRHGYEPESTELASHGIGENRSVAFHSPYGCSKGAADQYVLDYARTFGMPAAVFRMSCIYGPHQFGNEDQGWVAHFILKALRGEPITLYGDGRQVRDILYVDDLLRAMTEVRAGIAEYSGHAFNIGGGPDNAISLLELLDEIGLLRGNKPEVRFDDWRPADQRYYVSDIRNFTARSGWEPVVGAGDGVKKLYHWLARNRQLDAASFATPV